MNKPKQRLETKENLYVGNSQSSRLFFESVTPNLCNTRIELCTSKLVLYIQHIRNFTFYIHIFMFIHTIYTYRDVSFMDIFSWLKVWAAPVPRHKWYVTPIFGVMCDK